MCQGGVVTGAVVTVPSGGTVICTITNRAVSPQLTLVKTVTNDNGGTAQATDWTLTADGPTPISGATGAPAVTAAAVAVGSYTLSEAGPPFYDAGSWVCTGATAQSGSTVTLAEGDDVTCTVTNDDQAPVWVISKSSNPASGSTVQPGSTITYTVIATRTGGVTATGVQVIDDLSGVLDHATLVGAPEPSTGTVDVTGSTLTWSIPTLSGAESITYTVQVDSGATGVTLQNSVSSPGSSCSTGASGLRGATVALTAPVSCATTTVHYTPATAGGSAPTTPPSTGSVVGPGPTSYPPAASALSNTGVSVWPQVLIGWAFVLAGLLILLAGRKRRSGVNSA